MIRRILFDLDGTLLDGTPSARKPLTGLQRTDAALRAMPFGALAQTHARRPLPVILERWLAVSAQREAQEARRTDARCA